jgi:DNA-binding transcriptional ArsR family regulator
VAKEKSSEEKRGERPNAVPRADRIDAPTPGDLDLVWKALADPTRRAILDFLRDGPRTTTAIVERFPQLSRFGVMKHIDVLRDANLVLTREQGRQRINTINAVPIRQIYERWITPYSGLWATQLLSLKRSLEGIEKETQ